MEDRLKAALRLVEAKARPAVTAALGLADRKRLVENGTSGRFHEGKDSGKEAQVVLTWSRVHMFMRPEWRCLPQFA